MTDLEADPSVEVVVFQSANPNFLIAHLDVSKAAEQPGVLGLWRDWRRARMSAKPRGSPERRGHSAAVIAARISSLSAPLSVVGSPP